MEYTLTGVLALITTGGLSLQGAEDAATVAGLSGASAVAGVEANGMAMAAVSAQAEA